MIDPYEKIIMVMRNQSVSSGPFALGVMKDATTCSLGSIELTDEDYYKMSGVNVAADDTVLFAKVDDTYILIGKVVE